MKVIRARIAESSSGCRPGELQKRLAKLVGGVAVIDVGASTVTEMQEQQARAKDALNATRAAVGQGNIPGGGEVVVCLDEAVKTFALALRPMSRRRRCPDG